MGDRLIRWLAAGIIVALVISLIDAILLLGHIEGVFK